MAEVFQVPLTPAPEGGYTVTSPLLPELMTEGDTIEETIENVRDALQAALETYEDLNQRPRGTRRPLPANLRQEPQADAIWFKYLVTSP